MISVFFLMLNFEFEFEKEFLQYFAPQECHTSNGLIIIALRGIDDTIVAFMNFCVFVVVQMKGFYSIDNLPWPAKSQCISVA